jgi:hypothetical protein
MVKDITGNVFAEEQHSIKINCVMSYVLAVLLQLVRCENRTSLNVKMQAKQLSILHFFKQNIILRYDTVV